MKFTKIVWFLSFLFSSGFLFSGEIGESWEFNTNGDSQGWTALFGVSATEVSGGTLKIEVSGWFPSIQGPGFQLSASEYGFIYLRMKAERATSARFLWEKSDGTSGYLSFPVSGDSLFHEYQIPVYLNSGWDGEIAKFKKFEISSGFQGVGTRIEVDYIRIIHVGEKPAVKVFKPLRTILKPDDEIPLMAVVKNNGDTEGPMNSSLLLPEGVTVIEGNLSYDHGILKAGETDTLRWVVQGSQSGVASLKLMLFSQNDTSTAFLEARFTDHYWQQDEFFLSAWSPPYAWYPPPYDDAVFDYYHQANFDNVLWISPNEEAVGMVTKFNMKCLLIVSNLVGGDEYLRAADNLPSPEISAAQLANLDPVIEKFKNNSTVIGYFITDEPNAKAYPNIAKVVSYLREKDPGRLSFVNLYPSGQSEKTYGVPTYDQYVESFLDVVKPELLSYDRYIFFKDHDGSKFFSNLSTIRKWAQRYGVPFCNIIQAIGTDGEPDLNWRTPGEAEHRWLVYSSLAYGAKALIWFHWQADWGVTGSPDRDRIYASLRKVNGEIEKLGPYLVNLRSVGVYHTGSVPWGGDPLPENSLVKTVSGNANLIIGLFKDENSEDFLLLTNRDYRDSVKATITLNRSVSDLQFLNIVTGQWEPANYQNEENGAAFEITLPPGGGQLFAIGGVTVVNSPGEQSVPEKYELKQNYPNPFNPATTIEYSLAAAGYVTLSVYDVLGHRVGILVDEAQKSGTYKVIWSGENFPSGIYFYSLRAGKILLNRKMLVLR